MGIGVLELIIIAGILAVFGIGLAALIIIVISRSKTK